MSSTAITFIVCGLVIAASIPAALWLRRESDRHWALHCATRPMAEAFERLQAHIAESLTPALQRMTAGFAAMEPQMRALGDAMRKAGLR